jgi:alkylation response protein AidB-like acyl-CoA dehydrogenase
VFFALTAEQRSLQDSLRVLLADRMPETSVRALMDLPAGDDPMLWPDLLALAGTGDHVHTAVVMEVLGQALYIGPYLSSAVRAAALLAAAGDTVSWQAVVDGSLRVAVATVDDTGRLPSAFSLREGRVSGTASFVLDGMTADRLLVLADSAGAPCFVEVDAADHGVARTPLPGLDQTRKLARVALMDAPGEVLLLPDVPAALDGLQRLTIAAVAAEQVGSAQAAFDAALDHARSRQQFGRVIGSYQSIKHRFADLALGLEQARAAAYNAAWVLDNHAASSKEVAEATALARIVCTQASLEASESCVQIRGGQGFRWDNVAHLYLKRAKSSQLLFGDPSLEREHVAELLDLS